MRNMFCAAIAALALVVPASAQGWGTIKGKVTWNGDAPKVETIKVDKDQQHCLGAGPLSKTDLIVDASSKGVANVLVWLAPVGDGKIPVHPSMQSVPSKPHLIDQPRCQFLPRVSAVRAGQPVIIRNSAPIAHNARLSGHPEVNGTINLNIPAGGQIEKKLKAERRPMLLNCDIHPWMAGRLAVFDHPYFAVTAADGSFELKNAPAGNYVLYVQHERTGWVHSPKSSKGQPIKIPAGGTLDLKFEMKPADLN